MMHSVPFSYKHNANLAQNPSYIDNKMHLHVIEQQRWKIKYVNHK